MSSTGLADGQLIGIKQIVRPAVRSDAVKIEVLVGDKIVARSQTKPFPVVLYPPPALNDLDADVTVRAYDAAGVIGEAKTRVHVDTERPSANFTPGLTAAVHGPTTITAAVPDDVVQVVLSDASGEIARATSAPWTLAWDTRGHSGQVRFAVTDRAGNLSQFTGRYRVDEQGPQISLYRSGSAGWGDPWPRGVNYLDASVKDVTGLSRIEWWVEGALRSTDRTLRYDFGARSRTVPVEVRAWDPWGNASVTELPIVIDADSPRVTSITPANLALVRGSRITSTVQATDATSIDWVSLAGAIADRTAPYTSSIPAGPDGKKTLTWHLADLWGNTTTAHRVVIVDNTKPTLKVTKGPVNKAKVNGTVKLDASAGDRNGVSRVELLINGKVVARDTTSAYSFSIMPSRYGKKFTVALRAYDKAGNSTTTATRTWYR
ncbi:Ig-like domain-containing protein [Actinoplanes sp. NPDC051346]|uniref:Ig-like domain-containing protein n=1 Tax=Actinoplanes sp. NPDC051346 TaxID=3155048 RepID=UPI0034289D5C